ncbi:seminal fluid protein CSSFP028 [Danaus plexippus plexippus]|uniref:beta-glucosidase n=1 Tax=Danaus plexippus plexippus TaxID=278856 RepID=A0A212F6B1_DANPL|nr:seminal fluid protein CSSFP028 [Danaus plexippus plexippus]
MSRTQHPRLFAPRTAAHTSRIIRFNLYSVHVQGPQHFQRFDFLGLNHYTTYLVTKNKSKISMTPSFEADTGGILSQKAEWPKSNSTWLKVVPWGFRKALNWIKNKYDNPIVFITENGIALERGLTDRRRVNYIDAYLRALHAAILKDNCQVIGYTYWSLIDNFEWTRGYS